MNGYRIIGSGIDIVETSRMEDMLEKWGPKFKDKVFLPQEQAYCDSKALPMSHYAGRFAVKEAVSKAFGTGIGEHIGWLDMEVVRDDSTGAPAVTFSEKGRQLLADRQASQVLISLSHSKNYAVAHALLAVES